jgi:small neutral amino acid transporter SnatA (MarC family)
MSAAVLLVAAGEVQKIPGVTGIHMVRRTVGFLLSAFAVQFMLDGLLERRLFR